MAAPIEGTYTLDGMLQGKIPESAHESMTGNLREWAKSATESGFPFSLDVDGGQFSLLCGSQRQQITGAGVVVTDTLRDSLNALIESFPPEGRAQLFSTVRSSEIVKGAEVQGLYLIGQDGLIRVQTREVERETTAPEAPLSGKDKLKLGLIVAAVLVVFLGVSSLFVDFKKMFGGVKERLTVLKVEAIDFRPELYEDYVVVTLESLDRRKGGVLVKIKRGPRWQEIDASHLPVSDQGLSWDELLVLSNLKRGYIPCLFFGREPGVASEGKIPITSLTVMEEAPAFLSLPRGMLVQRIELAR